jgi:hypothetical protein
MAWLGMVNSAKFKRKAMILQSLTSPGKGGLVEFDGPTALRVSGSSPLRRARKPCNCKKLQGFCFFLGASLHRQPRPVK